MTDLRSLAQPAARLLLALIFLVAGFGKLADVQGFTAYMTSGGVPALLAWPTILLEIVGGLFLIAGWQTRAAALLLAGFSILAGLLFHFQPADQMQMTMFLKNLAIAGGLLLLAAQGAGRWSLDEGRIPAARPA
ncbi:MAG: DoxX family protein [Rhodobacteraceae bacterium]|nr:DoxX family protein [Paracoccaceae bacterium]